MNEYSDILLFVVVIVAFIAGYSIVSFCVKKIKEHLHSLRAGDKNQFFDQPQMQQKTNRETQDEAKFEVFNNIHTDNEKITTRPFDEVLYTSGKKMREDNHFFKKQPSLFPSLIAALMLLGAYANWPYGYYQLLRWVTTAAAVFIAATAYKQKRMSIVWLFSAVTVLFNPLVPVHLSREIWQYIDAISAILFIVAGIILRKRAGDESNLFGRK